VRVSNALAIWVGLSATLSAPHSFAQDKKFDVYPAPYEFIGKTDECSGPGETAVKTQLVATNVEVRFDQYAIASVGYDCSVTVKKAAEPTSQKTFDCESGQRVPAEPYAGQPGPVTALIDVRAEAEICLRPFDFEVSVTGPVEVTSRDTNNPVGRGSLKARAAAWIPGREPLFGALREPIDVATYFAFVTLNLGCLRGPDDPVTGRPVLSSGDSVSFRLESELKPECRYGDCVEKLTFRPFDKAATYWSCSIPEGQP